MKNYFMVCLPYLFSLPVYSVLPPSPHTQTHSIVMGISGPVADYVVPWIMGLMHTYNGRCAPREKAL